MWQFIIIRCVKLNLYRTNEKKKPVIVKKIFFLQTLNETWSKRQNKGYEMEKWCCFYFHACLHTCHQEGAGHSVAHTLYVTWCVTLSIGVTVSLKRFSTSPLTCPASQDTENHLTAVFYWTQATLKQTVCRCVWWWSLRAQLVKRRPVCCRARPALQWEWGNLARPVSMYVSGHLTAGWTLPGWPAVVNTAPLTGHTEWDNLLSFWAGVLTHAHILFMPWGLARLVPISGQDQSGGQPGLRNGTGGWRRGSPFQPER